MSTITIYDTKLSPELNAQVDNIQDYLNTLQSYVTNIEVQYQKIELDMNLKIVLDQEYQTKRIGNYLDLYQDGKHFYFFIMGATWGAKMTINLQLGLDTINTFSGDFHFSNRTHIIREHRNRFNNLAPLTEGNNVLFDKVDDVDEGISGAVQYKKSDTTIYYGNKYLNQKWYLVYRSSLQPSLNDPIDCLLVPSKGVPYQAPNTSYYHVSASDLHDTKYRYIMIQDNTEDTTIYKEGNGNYTWSLGQYIANKQVYGVVYHRTSETATTIDFWLLFRKNDGSFVLRSRPHGTSLNIQDGTMCRVLDNKTTDLDEIHVAPGESYPAPTTRPDLTYSIDDIDRTQSTNVKIIELPYCPIPIEWDEHLSMILPDGWEINSEKFIAPNSTLKKRLPNFNQTIIEGEDLGLSHSFDLSEQQLYTLKYYPRGLIRDPKLKHSSLYTYKLSYDSYSMVIPFEKLNQTRYIFDDGIKLNVDYKQSNSISSTCGFKMYFTDGTYTDNQDYGTYLISNRNLESPIYTNAYLDYIRNGYNFDRKNASRSEAQSWIGAGITLVGGILSAVAGAGSAGLGTIAGISLVSSAITSLSNAAFNTASTELSLEEKLKTAQNQATSVNGCDDLCMLDWYNGNKLHIIEYQVSEKLQIVMNDVFYYCGYATDRYAIPRLNTRIWFNYLQCEPMFDEEQTTVYQEFLKDIKARYSAGVTIFHNWYGEYHLERTYENWENVLISW